MCLTKWLAKKMLSADADRYSAAEILNATLGRLDRVERHEHKGFDYERLIEQMGKYFEIVHVSGHPAGFLPRGVCFGIGIVAQVRRQPA